MARAAIEIRGIHNSTRTGADVRNIIDMKTTETEKIKLKHSACQDFRVCFTKTVFLA